MSHLEEFFSSMKCVFSIKGTHIPLGVSSFAAPKETPLQLPHPDKFQFNLGNGRKTRDPEEAAKLFLEREYPEVIKENQGPIFIPEFFISKVPELLEYDYKAEDVRSVNKLEEKYVKDGQLWGDKSEFLVFQQLQKILLQDERKYEDIVVFHGYKTKWEKEGESDFLIVSNRHRSIVSIECKSDLSKPTANKILEQSNRTFRFLSGNLSFGQLGWTFVRVCALKSINNDSNKNDDNNNKLFICDQCKRFVICDEQPLADIWNNIFSHLKIESSENRNEYLEHVKRLAFLMHVNFPKEPVTRVNAVSKLHENIDKASSLANIIMWTRAQYATFYQNEKKVLFKSPFGTGKTVLLREKAVELAKGVLQKATQQPKQMSKSEKRKMNKMYGQKQSNDDVVAKEELGRREKIPPPSPDSVQEHDDFHTVYFLILVQYAKVSGDNLLGVAEAKHFFRFRGAKNIKVLTWSDIVDDVQQETGHNSDILTAFIKKHANSPGIFIDEYSANFLHNGQMFDVAVNKLVTGMQRVWPQLLALVMSNPEVMTCFKRVAALVTSILKQKADLVATVATKELQSILQTMFGGIVSEDNPTKAIAGFLLQLSKVRLEKISKSDLKRLFDDLFDVEATRQLKSILHYDPETRKGAALLSKFIEKNDLFHSKVSLSVAAEFLKSLTTLSPQNYLWIAVNKDDRVFKWSQLSQFKLFPDVDGFCSPQLSHNLRNTYEVTVEATASDTDPKYVNRTNVLKGRAPKIRKLIFGTKTEEGRVEALFKSFKDGLDFIGSTDDLLILWNDSFGPEFVKLHARLVQYFLDRNVPIHVINVSQQKDKMQDLKIGNADSFFDKGRKGVVLGDMTAVQGCDFTSVLVYITTARNKSEEILLGWKEPPWKRNTRISYNGIQYNSLGNVLLRAMCNLVIVECSEGSGGDDQNKPADIELD